MLVAGALASEDARTSVALEGRGVMSERVAMLVTRLPASRESLAAGAALKVEVPSAHADSYSRLLSGGYSTSSMGE